MQIDPLLINFGQGVVITTAFLVLIYFGFIYALSFKKDRILIKINRLNYINYLNIRLVKLPLPETLYGIRRGWVKHEYLTCFTEQDGKWSEVKTSFDYFKNRGLTTYTNLSQATEKYNQTIIESYTNQNKKKEIKLKETVIK